MMKKFGAEATMKRIAYDQVITESPLMTLSEDSELVHRSIC